MSKIHSFYKKQGPASVILSVALSVLFVVTLVEAATTISTNINTGGTLSVTGASTLMGALNASSTAQITGAFTTYGNGTFGDASTDVNLFTGTLQASTTALFTNGLTTYGNSTFGDASTDTNLFTGTLQASTTALFSGVATFYNNLIISQSATTTLSLPSAGLNADSDTLVIDPNANRIGVLTATPNTALEVAGTASTTSLVIGGGTAITANYSATASLDFPVIGASSCQSLTITVNGAADGDIVSLGVPTALANASTTFTTTGFVSAANTVTVRICQVATSASSDPAAANVKVEVRKY